ncbi:MAG: membrane protein insertion efficiency factor YidD [Desulfamplus sp.]|nr:membrane protein insertion efficiency factor YidD [Desulfamplus sp.]
MKWIILTLIKLYQYIVSPMIGPVCRFYPSCSQYAFEAVSKYGCLKGSFLAIKRLLKCHPFNQGGFDPVP